MNTKLYRPSRRFTNLAISPVCGTIIVRWSMFVLVLLAIYGRASSAVGDDVEEKDSRKIQFVVDVEPFVAEIDDNDRPKEDLRYAAVIRGFSPLLVFRPDPTPRHLLPINFTDVYYALASVDSSPPATRLRKFAEPKRGGRHRFRASLIENYEPRLAPPAGKHVSFSGGVTLGVSQLFQTGLAGNAFQRARAITHPPLEQYALFAPSVEEAKQLGDDFLYCYDKVLLPGVRKLIEAGKAGLINERGEAAPNLVELEKKLAVAKSETEGIEYLIPGTLTDLKTKRTLLAVDLAGVKARIAAIESKLKDLRPRLSGNEQLNDKLIEQKVSAEIDLTSLAAQQKALDELLDGQRKLTAVGQLNSEVVKARRSSERTAQSLRLCEEVLADLTPFQLADDTVVIRPLQFHVE